MTSIQVQQLCKSKALQQLGFEELISTHISWVLLCKTLVLKIKKPVCFKFLDYSNLDKREEYCEQELILNTRFAPGVYLKTVRITTQGNTFFIDGIGKVIDYAVVMKRLEYRYLLANCFKNSTELNIASIKLLVDYVFYQHTISKTVHKPFHHDEFSERFNQVLKITKLISELFGKDGVKKVEKSVLISEQFLVSKNNLFVSRVTDGL